MERLDGMTLKEMETLSGMEGSGILFYAREGLLSPQQMKNGSQTYSDEDLNILLRIKLLRLLHISLEEITALKNGTKEWSDTLEQQISALEQEPQGSDSAQNICRAIREDCTGFYDLDAKKYLDCLSETDQEAGNPSLKGDETAQVFHPWRRYFARSLDTCIYAYLCSIFLAFVFHMNLKNESITQMLFDTVIQILMMLFLEPLFLHLFGTTPGKKIFGLSIVRSDGIRLSYQEGLNRTWRVLGTGMGYYIPIYNLVRLWKSYQLCSEHKTQPWDDDISYQIRDTKWYRGVIFVGINILLWGLLTLTTAFAELPPNRGAMTVAEFAENYNYLVDYFDVDGRHLNPDGTWAEKTEDGLYAIDLGNMETPEFSYMVENGDITEVSFQWETKNQGLVPSYHTEMMLAALSYAGVQDGMGIFSDEIRERIPDSSLEDFSFTEGDVQVMCDVEHSGYFDGYSAMLVPEETANENEYHMVFVMKKIGKTP